MHNPKSTANRTHRSLIHRYVFGALSHCIKRKLYDLALFCFISCHCFIRIVFVVVVADWLFVFVYFFALKLPLPLHLGI